MATAEKLLNEANYAIQSITAGDSRDNRRNAARASALCRKIIRKHPTSTEARSAHAILRRLGDEAYASNLSSRHQHSIEHKPLEVSTSQSTPAKLTQSGEDGGINWRGILGLILKAPMSVLVVVGGLIIFLFAFGGPLIWVLLLTLVIFSGPVKQLLNSAKIQDLNKLIAKANRSNQLHKRR